jgi:propionate CoA-transferase
LRVVSTKEAVSLIHDGDTLLIGGSGGGHAVPESLILALEDRFLNDSQPKGITLLHPVGLGDGAGHGVDHLAYPDLLKRIIAGAFVNSPKIAELAKKDAIQAYNLPQGTLSQLMREMAAGRPGLITHVGLHTFVDPRYSGGRQSPSAAEDLLEVIELDNQEWLFYKSLPVDVAFLRGTTADEDGNISMEHEAVFGEMLSMAQAARNAGGVVIVQVARLAQRGTLPAKQVKIPGMLVDLVVVDPDQEQTYQTKFSPAYAGLLRVPLSEISPLPFDARKVIARRAAMELFPGAVCNLGTGVSTGIANVAAEEGFLDQILLTNEQGLIGGAPASGMDAGASMNYSAMVDQPYQFDFYDGGGLDLAFLSFAQVDAQGNVNVSRFNGRIIGPGGFPNISQNAKKVVFSGTLTAGGLDIAWEGDNTHIRREGKFPKFVALLEQITYNGGLGWERGQEVLFITERAVFRLGPEGLELIETAPGIDVEGQIMAVMEFRPRVSPSLGEMDSRIFDPEPMAYSADLEKQPRLNIPPRLRDWEHPDDSFGPQ